AAARGRRPAVRPGDGGRAGRGPGVRARHDAPRGGQLPGPHAGPRAAGNRGVTAGEGLTVTQRRYVSAADAHYGGKPAGAADGAYVLALFGDVATEACIRMDGDEGLFASYSDVQFRAPVLGGDVIETTATVVRVGRRSRELAFEARVACRANPERGPSASDVLESPLTVVTARGTVVVPVAAG